MLITYFEYSKPIPIFATSKEFTNDTKLKQMTTSNNAVRNADNKFGITRIETVSKCIATIVDIELIENYSSLYIYFENEQQRDAFLLFAPKSLKFKKSTLSGMNDDGKVFRDFSAVSYIQPTIKKFGETNNVTGDTNETGIKRMLKVLKFIKTI